MPIAESLKITAEEYRAMPEDGRRYQLIDGELFMAPAPYRDHQDVSRNLGFILLKHLEKHAAGVLYFAPLDVYLSEHNVVQPDLLYVSRERTSILTDLGAEGSPDFVVEILSPRTAKLDRASKRKLYAAHGVNELWLVEPRKKTIEIFRLQDDAEKPVKVHSANSIVTSPTFPGLKFRAAEIFRG
ncbi:MAG TPA: Uma2 family endonuclease [Verrucomicrobiae bacterium]|jgi:Uma2 family endonuclease